MTEEKTLLAQAERDLLRARKALVEVQRIHENLKSKPLVKRILELHGGTRLRRADLDDVFPGLRNLPGLYAVLELTRGALQPIVDEGTETVDDLVSLYEANEKLFSSSEGIQGLLDSLEKAIRAAKEPQSKIDVATIANVTLIIANSLELVKSFFGH